MPTWITNELISLVNAIAALAIFAATVVLAIYTRLLAKRTAEPFVVFYLKSSESSAQAMNQLIVNTGNATAFDIRAKMSPAPPQPNDESPKGDLVRELSLLPPGQSISFAGSLGRDIADETFDVSVSWATKPGGKRSVPLKYSVTARDGYAAGFQVKGIHHIASALETMAKKNAN